LTCGYRYHLHQPSIGDGITFLGNSMSLRHYAAALCAGAALGGPAHAATSATFAEISQLKYELIDLDLTDGITPAITIAPNFIYAASDEYGAGPDGERQAIRVEGSTGITRTFGETEAATSAARVTSSARVSAAEKGFESVAAYNYGFTLTPNTGLIVSALGKLSLDQPNNNDSYASLSLRGELVAGTYPDNQWTTFTADYTTDRWQGGLTEATINLSGYLFTQKQALSGTLSTGTRALAYLYPPITPPIPSPVPEPTSWMLLLAGAGLIGARARTLGRAQANSDRFV
jgi:hypothetical protein